MHWTSPQRIISNGFPQEKKDETIRTLSDYSNFKKESPAIYYNSKNKEIYINLAKSCEVSYAKSKVFLDLGFLDQNLTEIYDDSKIIFKGVLVNGKKFQVEISQKDLERITIIGADSEMPQLQSNKFTIDLPKDLSLKSLSVNGGTNIQDLTEIKSISDNTTISLQDDYAVIPEGKIKYLDTYDSLQLNSAFKGTVSLRNGNQNRNNEEVTNDQKKMGDVWPSVFINGMQIFDNLTLPDDNFDKSCNLKINTDDFQENSEDYEAIADFILKFPNSPLLREDLLDKIAENIDLHKEKNLDFVLTLLNNDFWKNSNLSRISDERFLKAIFKNKTFDSNCDLMNRLMKLENFSFTKFKSIIQEDNLFDYFQMILKNPKFDVNSEKIYQFIKENPNDISVNLILNDEKFIITDDLLNNSLRSKNNTLLDFMIGIKLKNPESKITDIIKALKNLTEDDIEGSRSLYNFLKGFWKNKNFLPNHILYKEYLFKYPNSDLCQLCCPHVNFKITEDIKEFVAKNSNTALSHYVCNLIDLKDSNNMKFVLDVIKKNPDSTFIKVVLLNVTFDIQNELVKSFIKENPNLKLDLKFITYNFNSQKIIDTLKDLKYKINNPEILDELFVIVKENPNSILAEYISESKYIDFNKENVIDFILNQIKSDNSNKFLIRFLNNKNFDINNPKITEFINQNLNNSNLLLLFISNKKFDPYQNEKFLDYLKTNKPIELLLILFSSNKLELDEDWIQDLFKKNELFKAFAFPNSKFAQDYFTKNKNFIYINFLGLNNTLDVDADWVQKLISENPNSIFSSSIGSSINLDPNQDWVIDLIIANPRSIFTKKIINNPKFDCFHPRINEFKNLLDFEIHYNLRIIQDMKLKFI